MKPILLLALGCSLACGSSPATTTREIVYEETPAPPPAADAGEPDMRPEVTAFLAEPKFDTGRKFTVRDASEVGDFLIQYEDGAKPTIAYVACPFSMNPKLRQRAAGGNAPIIEDPALDPSSPELWILGRAVVGLQSSTYEFFFDIPVGQVVQLAVACRSLKVTAKLIQATDTSLGLAQEFFNLAYPLSDQTKVTTAGAPIKAAPGLEANCVSIGGPGVGVSNATRRVRLPLPANIGIETPIPEGATAYRVLANPAVTSRVFFGGGVNIAGIPVDATAAPIPDGAVAVEVDNISGSAHVAELVYVMGVSGDPAW